MPEGDTVWRTARRLDQALSGRTLVVSDFRVLAFATVDLRGQPVLETVSRGKHLLTRLPDVSVHTHLKMEGSWHLYRPTTPWRAPAHQARLVLGNDEWSAVGFRLGVVEVVGRDHEDDVVGHLGPDLLGPDWDRDEAIRRITADAEPSLGEALLDQRNLAGIGTVYRSEALFIGGVSPFRPVGDVDDVGAVVDIVQRLMKANLDNVQQVTTGSSRRGEEHWVYARARKPCRRCGTAIQTTVYGAPVRERVVYWCPSCQQ